MSSLENEPCKFHKMELDDRILKAIAKLGWLTPTIIQEQAIPFLLEGKDVLLRARTGSGKTAAFAIPIVQKILNSKQSSTDRSLKVLVLAPTKELCSQIHTVFCALTCKCSQEVKCANISSNTEMSAQKSLLVERPDIIVSTPALILGVLKAENSNLRNSLGMLALDEADLMFSCGYEAEMKEILHFMPQVFQAVLTSATLTEDVLSLKKMVLHNPVILKLGEPNMAPSTQLFHYHLEAEEMEKASILYSLLKLNLVRGKSIIFVNTVDRCYKLKLFLEQFAIHCIVINSELPSVIRCHSVNQFNQGVYDIIIASDEVILEQPDASTNFKRKKDRESGIARGIDFQSVSNVINFDFPLTINSYVHRAGRTARGTNEGNVLSFVNIKERHLLTTVQEHLQSCSDKDTDQTLIQAYKFKLEEVEAFVYRAKDAWKAVTKIAVREARLLELKKEIFSCEKLKAYFEDNPHDLEVLRHDKALHTVKVQPHLADVPEYIIPESLKRLSRTSKKIRKDHVTKTKSNTKHHLKKINPLLVVESTKFRNRRKR